MTSLVGKFENFCRGNASASIIITPLEELAKLAEHYSMSSLLEFISFAYFECFWLKSSPT